MRPETDRRSLPLLAVAALPALLGITAVIVVVAALVGLSPFWSTEERTLSEAAYAGDRASVLLLLGQGADPNAPATMRAGTISGEPVQLEPMEAAIRNGDVELVRMLVDHGTRVDGEHGTRAACLARLRGAPEIVDLLAAEGAVPSPDECEGIDFTS